MLPAVTWWALFMRHNSLAISCAHQVALYIDCVMVSLTQPMLHRSDSGNSAPNSTGLRYTRYRHWPQTPRLSRQKAKWVMDRSCHGR